MEQPPLTIKLRCTSWGQLDAIYRRDLMRSAVFLKTKKPPPLETSVRINLTLPSETLIVLSGKISAHIPAGGMEGRGPGVDIRLNTIPQSAMWLIESALASAKSKESSAVRSLPPAATGRAIEQRRAPTHTSQRGSAAQLSDISLEDGTPVVEAESQLLEALGQELVALRKRNPFQILGVTYDATDQDVRTAFAKLTKKYHPDRFARYESREVRDQASEVYILIRDAYRRIGSPRAREQTLGALHGKSPAPLRSERSQRMGPATEAAAPRRAAPPAPPRSPGEAAPLPPPPSPGLAGEDLFNDEPAAPDASAGSASIDLGTARSRGSEVERAYALLAQDHVKDALKIFDMVWHRNPTDLRARAGVELCAGLAALEERDRLEAAQRFEMVLELDPENERAAHELAEMRRQATQDRKGLLSRLLGKKE